MQEQFLAADRKIKNLSSIKEIKEFEIFKKFIEFGDCLFGECENCSIYEACDKLKKLIIQNNSDSVDPFFDSYWINSFLYYFIIRPFHRERIIDLLIIFIIEFESKRSFIIEQLQTNQIYSSKYIKHVLTSQGILPNDNDYENLDQFSLILYDDNSLAKFLQNDDDEKLKVLYNDAPNAFQDLINLPRLPEYNEFFNTIYEFNAPVIDACALFGSTKCFKFLLLNNFTFNLSTIGMSVAGGNFDIIHMLEQEHASFDSFFDVSIKFRHTAIAEWLLSNYRCNYIDIIDCILYLDIAAFLFLSENGAFLGYNQYHYRYNICPIGFCALYYICPYELYKYLVDKGSPFDKKCKCPKIDEFFPFSALCFNKYQNIDAIKLLLEKGGNPTLPYTYNDLTAYPLYSVCTKSNVDINIIQQFLDRNVKINNGLMKQNTTVMTPLSELCRQNKIQEAVYLIEKCADINLGKCPPLLSLCQCENVNIDAVLYLIQKGANVNNGSIPPLFALCDNPHPNKQLIQHLIENGAKTAPTASQPNPLSLLLKHENVDIDLVQFLIDNGAKINSGIPSPLSYYCSNSHVDLKIIQYLVGLGANVNNPHSLIALCSQQHPNKDAIRFLIDHGANVNQPNLLVSLCQQDNVSIDVIELLISCGADVNKNNPILYLALNSKPDYEAIQYLIDKGAIFKGIKILDSLCGMMNVNIDTIKFFINKGVDVKEGNPIYSLCKSSKPNLDVLKLLLENGADINKE